MLKKLTVLFAFAIFVLLIGWAIMPVQAHCFGNHTGNHPHCVSDDDDSGRSDFDLAILTIVDDPGVAVSGDDVRVVDTDSTLYADSKVVDPLGDPCLLAGVINKGAFFIDFIEFDPNEAQEGCTSLTEADIPNEFGRTYILIFPEGVRACPTLGLTLVGGFCELTVKRRAVMRAEKMFSGGKNPKTPMRFLFRIKRDGGVIESYEVRTDENVPVTIDGPDTRTLTYDGKATLFRVGQIDDPVPGGFVSDSFVFPFELTVERVPQ